MSEVRELLDGLARSPEARPFAELLAPLAAHDRERGSDLVRTLAVFFACGENVSETAERLFLHRNSVAYRLERVEEITGLNYRDHRATLAMRIGLLALDTEEEACPG